MSHHPRRSHHPLRIVLLAAVLAVTTVALSQCRMVKDNVTGIEMTAGSLSRRSNCNSNCNKAYEILLRIEAARHSAAIRACRSDRSCKINEDKRHDRIGDELDNLRKKCKKGCYNEGGGNGGHGDR
jgi:hypothetical protein